MNNKEGKGFDPYIRIDSVEEGSIAQELEIEEGDKLIKINGSSIKDFIDYKFLVTDTYLEVEVLKKKGERWILEIEKDYDEPLGISFSEVIFDGLKQCHNNCIFCFVKQAPSNSRKTLNLRDDDYRFSFLGGSYTTLTNVSESEFDRIKSMNLSPLNISVHSTDSEVRVRMLNNNKAGRILEQIEELASFGIEMNTQVVLCPEINDGEVLEKTINDLGKFIPNVKSLAIVPVGLTKYREELHDLRSFTQQEAKSIINTIKKWQTKFRNEFGIDFVYLSDEFYLLANEEFPSEDSYDGFPQLENGIGMVRLLLDEFKALEGNLPKKIDGERKVSLFTSVLGSKAILPIINSLNKIENLKVKVNVVENKYFGPDVTVTGLLTARDILDKLKREMDLGDLVLIPEITLNDDDLFLDNISWGYFSSEVAVEVLRVKNDAFDLVKKVLGEYFGGGYNG
ncbi:DUF512 domain-containing protein [Halonatronum saccharophilum]|uniref:DUF512 domain-containing protein n=1 Tax=Halonatronum saccharophilum TaxID=150060 RepID=UPI0004810D5B|nr:DUF512 domain-containing protein [Halonatronum saccharophilum]